MGGGQLACYPLIDFVEDVTRVTNNGNHQTLILYIAFVEEVTRVTNN